MYTHMFLFAMTSPCHATLAWMVTSGRWYPPSCEPSHPQASLRQACPTLGWLCMKFCRLRKKRTLCHAEAKNIVVMLHMATPLRCQNASCILTINRIAETCNFVQLVFFTECNWVASFGLGNSFLSSSMCFGLPTTTPHL